jgi:hypothetical protein
MKIDIKRWDVTSDFCYGIERIRIHVSEPCRNILRDKVRFADADRRAERKNLDYKDENRNARQDKPFALWGSYKYFEFIEQL